MVNSYIGKLGTKFTHQRKACITDSFDMCIALK